MRDGIQSTVVDHLIRALRQLGDPSSLPAWGRASATLDHMGAKLSDVVLQAGVNYEAFVRPRVQRIHASYPEGATSTGFLRVLDVVGPEVVLGIARGRKLRTIRELTEFLVAEEIDTPSELRKWLMKQGNPVRLRQVHGVGPKSVSFLKLLVGLDAVAVDIHILRFVAGAGCTARDPDKVEELLSQAAHHLGMRVEQVDALVWRSMAGNV